MMDNHVKVVNATYKLLEFFPDNEPLKYKAKEKALKVLENLTLVSSALGWVSLQKEKASAELLDDIEILKNYLQLAKYQGWVGGINYLILLKEYDEIKSRIKPPSEIIKQTIDQKSNVSQQQEINTKNTSFIFDKNKEYKKPETIEDLEDLKPIIPHPSSLDTIESQGKAVERQHKILQIINNMGGAQVSDIIKEIPNITKRTIRRDLDDLLKKAKIVRSGEWNRVSYQIYPIKTT